MHDALLGKKAMLCHLSQSSLLCWSRWPKSAKALFSKPSRFRKNSDSVCQNLGIFRVIQWKSENFYLVSHDESWFPWHLWLSETGSFLHGSAEVWRSPDCLQPLCAWRCRSHAKVFHPLENLDMSCQTCIYVYIYIHTHMYINICIYIYT